MTIEFRVDFIIAGVLAVTHMFFLAFAYSPPFKHACVCDCKCPAGSHVG